MYVSELRKAAKMAKKHLRAVFAHCDADQSGKLSGEEMLNAMMEEFELDFNDFSQDLQDTLTDMYNDMDVDEDGEISFKGTYIPFEEFLLQIFACNMR